LQGFTTKLFMFYDIHPCCSANRGRSPWKREASEGKYRNMATRDAKGTAKSGKAQRKSQRRSFLAIDVHSHVRVAAVEEFLRKNRAADASGQRSWIAESSQPFQERQAKLIRPKHTDPKVRLKDMDKMGVDIQVLSMNLPQSCYRSEGKKGLEVARACNDGIAEFVNTNPHRFVGIGAVPLQDATLAVQELERAVTLLDLRGVVISSNIRSHDLGEPDFSAFWAKAEELGVPVFIHPQGFSQPDRLQKFFLGNSIGQPLEEALAMASLIHEGVMERFPKLKVCIDHGGGFLPYYPGRVDRAFEVRPEAGVNMKKRPSDTMRRFYYDTVIFDRDMLAFLVNRVGAGKVMMGTDYPVAMGEWDPVGFIRRNRKLSRDAKERLLWKNAAGLLKIAA
jgi:aminocarboxymuconate-semialdehyde decarboxylase